jgi:hypothetical protein
MITSLLTASLLTSTTLACGDTTAPPPVRPNVDLAICLDISGSMDGLIDSAKARLWSVVNDLATAKPVPQLRVALLTYGCDAYDPATGWVVVDAPLTEDLDLISQKLFALRTNGGTELVGRVVDKAARSLEWSTDPNALKIIIVAGNEGADQDKEVLYQAASKTSIEKGVIVNSIFCGSATDPIAVAWGEVAKLADGQFLCIDQSTGAAIAETPFDAQLGVLSSTINTTYLPVGSTGRVAWANQAAQDANAAGLGGGAAAQRCQTKGGELYDNRQWDLVDGCAKGTMKLEEIKDEELPEEMRGKTLDEKRAILAKHEAKRKAVQDEIHQLQVKRDAFVAAESEKRAAAQGATLDDALKSAIRTQATQKGMRFPAPTPPQGAPPASGSVSSASPTAPASVPAQVPAQTGS